MATDAAFSSDTIVLIHGLWLTPLSWEKWIDHYKAKGFNAIAPPWPGMEGDIEQVRSNTKPYEKLGIKEIADHYEQIIRELDKPPIIMGHSFGGLITQVLLDRGLGSAAVAISPAPIKGILALPLSALKVASVALKNPANRHKAVTLTPDEFRYGFGNLLSVEDSKRAYDRLAIPGPGRVLFQAAFSNLIPNSPAAVHPKSGNRPPLLLQANGKDHTVPAAVTKNAYKIQRKASSPTGLKEYPDRSHYTFAQDGWEGVADDALDWATQHARVPAAATA
jgi:alpha-beta hydrolase superfamily lysophospholipase